MVDQTGSLRTGRSFLAVFADLFGLPPHPAKWLVDLSTPKKGNTTMNTLVQRTVAAHAYLPQALEYLNQLILSGAEYPEAEYRTLYEYPSISQQQLVDAYDSQELAK